MSVKKTPWKCRWFGHRDEQLDGGYGKRREISAPCGIRRWRGLKDVVCLRCCRRATVDRPSYLDTFEVAK